MTDLDLLAFVAIAIGSFIVGRMTYTPDKWAQDKIIDMEKRTYERLQTHFTHSFEMFRKHVNNNLETMVKPMIDRGSVQVKSFRANSMEDMIKDIYKEFKTRGVSEEETKKEVMAALNIEENK